MGLITALWLVPLLAVVIVCAVLVLLRRRAVMTPAGSARRQYWRSVLVLGGTVTAVRVGICWDLTYRAFSRTESLSEVPFIALLMPEYLLAPGDPATPTGMWALTAALVVGSFVIVSAMALLIWRYMRASGPSG